MTDLRSMGLLLLVIGLGIALLGLVLWFGSRLGLGSLPGDVRIEREGWSCFFPIASMIVLSIVLTILVNLLLRYWRR